MPLTKGWFSDATEVFHSIACRNFYIHSCASMYSDN